MLTPKWRPPDAVEWEVVLFLSTRAFPSIHRAHHFFPLINNEPNTLLLVPVLLSRLPACPPASFCSSASRGTGRAPRRASRSSSTTCTDRPRSRDEGSSTAAAAAAAAAITTTSVVRRGAARVRGRPLPRPHRRPRTRPRRRRPRRPRPWRAATTWAAMGAEATEAPGRSFTPCPSPTPSRNLEWCSYRRASVSESFSQSVVEYRRNKETKKRSNVMDGWMDGWMDG